MSLKDTYDKIAENWHKDHQKDAWWIEGVEKFISLLQPGSLILDIGCGGGVKDRYLIDKGLKVLGIDFSEKMVEIARREVVGGEFLTMDLKNVHKIKQEFFGIFMQAVLLHIPKRELRGILRRILKKIKNGGYLYIAVKEKKPGGPEEEIKLEYDYGYSYKRFFSYFTPEEIEKHLSDLKMKIVFKIVKSSGGSRWIQIIAQKK